MNYRDMSAILFVSMSLLALLFLASMAWYSRLHGEPTGNEWLFTIQLLATLVAVVLIVRGFKK